MVIGSSRDLANFGQMFDIFGCADEARLCNPPRPALRNSKAAAVLKGDPKTLHLGVGFTFRNKVPIIDIGLRLTDVEERGLLHEPFTSKTNSDSVAETLKRHGATQDEINFLIQTSDWSGFEGERVELNAMTSDEFIAFIEDKFKEHGVGKIIPDDDILEIHARRMLERHMVLQELDRLLPGIHERVAEAVLPDDLHGLVEELLEETPELPWDAAVAEIINGDDEAGEP